jgi:hypothetical protein
MIEIKKLKKNWENKKDQNNEGQILKKLNWIKFNECNWKKKIQNKIK